MDKTETMREAFEEWAVKVRNDHGLPYFIIRNSNGDYADGRAQDAWIGWQAGIDKLMSDLFGAEE